MSDERRAEIEAVAEVLQEAETGTFGETYLQVAMGVIAALDRVRDARGDDEVVPVPACVREYHAMLAGDVDFLRAQRAKATADIEAARSPQGEDHEAGIEAGAWADAVDAYERSSALTVAGRIGAAIAAYLARVSAPKADEKQEAP